MRLEHLHAWLADATREEIPATEKWYKVVDIIKYALKEGRINVDCEWKTVVLILKWNMKFRGIGIVEVIWKAVPGVVNFRIGAAVDFHDMLHGLMVGIVIGTASLEVKLLQNLTVMREEVLYKVLIHLQKYYDVLDRERCMEILVGYGIRPRTMRVIRLYWYHLLIVARSGRYYTNPLLGLRGVTHG